MTTFTKEMQDDFAGIVTFMKQWARYQEKWIAADVGSDEATAAINDKQFYAAQSHRRCVKLGLNPVAVLGTPACQDANEYDRQIMKAVEAERAA